MDRCKWMDGCVFVNGKARDGVGWDAGDVDWMGLGAWGSIRCFSFLEPSRGHLGPHLALTWHQNGAKLGHLGAMIEHLGHIWRHLWAMLQHFWG